KEGENIVTFQHLLCGAAVAVLLGSAASAALADSFASPSDLVVVRIDKTNPAGGEAVHLDEIKTNGAAGQSPVVTINLPTTGNTAFSLPDLSNHDGHLQLSTDGHFLVLGGYAAAPGGTDPSTLASSTNPRVIAVVGANGVPDLSTRLTDAFNQ